VADKVVVPLDPVSGRNKIITVDHYGPTSYVTGGEVWPQQNTYGGPNSLGESNVIGVLSGSGATEDTLYVVIPITGGNGNLRGTIKLKWVGFTTGVEVTAGTNLSASHLRLSVLGG